MILRISAVGALLLAAGCATLPRPTAETASRAQARWPDASLPRLEQGRTLFVQRCSACHALPMPDSRTEAEWHQVMDEMSSEAKLTADERVLVERFVLAVRTRVE